MRAHLNAWSEIADVSDLPLGRWCRCLNLLIAWDRNGALDGLLTKVGDRETKDMVHGAMWSRDVYSCPRGNKMGRVA